MEPVTIETNNNTKDSSLGDSYDQSYEDDFEKDSSLEEKPTHAAPSSSPFKASRTTEDHDTGSNEDNTEKRDEEAKTIRKDRSSDVEASDNDSEPEDTYNFTEDQKRAMMELMVQKQEDADLLDEEPPEYDVRDRLLILNAELAKEPDPDENERSTRVGFKPEIVDLVAPPPDFSDEESQPNSARGEPQPTHVAPVGSGKADTKAETETDDNKKIVVERDGNFEVVSASDLTADERAIYITEEGGENQAKKKEKQTLNEKEQRKDRSKKPVEMQPRPPARPRPNTATTGPRRNVKVAPSPRPKSAGHNSGSNTSLDNFNYNSPYAMTPEQKEQSRELAKKMEEERREKERRKQEEEEIKKNDSESAFRAWLDAKTKERRRQERDQKHGDREREEQERSEQDEKPQQQGAKSKKKQKSKDSNSASTGTGSDPSPEDSLTSFDIIYPYLMAKGQTKEENEAAFKQWVKVKRQQGKQEKLLKRRQQQEQMEGFYIRPREECEKAFREWLRKKNADLRKQQEMDRQRSRMYRAQMKRSKKTSMLLKALKESNSFRFVDYYGYR